MPIEKTIETVERKIIKYFCDICGEYANAYPSAYSRNICYGCKKILCKNHIYEFDYVYFGGGDYPVSFCEGCWDKGGKYRTIIKKLEDKISLMHDKWINEAKK